MAGKLKIQIYVDEEIYQAFKDYVYSKYGTLHKYLGDEISRAMEEYLKQSANAHTQEIEHTISKPNKRHIQLLVWLASNFNHEVLYSDIESYIVENIGMDRRTKQKYINHFLVKMGFIKLSKALYGKNVIYKIDYERIYSFLKRHLTREELEELGITEEVIKVKVDSEPETNSEEAAQNKQVREEIRQYAVERYEAGDSLDEITQRLADFGVVLGKRAVRSIVRKARREEYV